MREVPVVRGSEVADAQASFDQVTNQPIISFRLNEVGARKFGQYTTENVGRPFAIVVGGRVISAPVTRTPILAGQGQIAGNFTIADVQELAAKLRSGTCP